MKKLRCAFVLLGFMVVLVPALCAAQSFSVDPDQGHPTQVLTIGGNGFGLNEGIDIYWDTNPVWFFVSGFDGSFSGKISVPSDATPGKHMIIASGRSTGFTLFSIFTVQGDPASISLSPDSGIVTTLVTVEGHGFLSGEVVVASLDTNPVCQSTADSSGDFSCSFVVPIGTDLGDHLVVASGQASGVNVQETFTVTDSSASISLSPDSGPANILVTVAGQGFLSGELVVVSLDTNPACQCVADSSGDSSCTFLVPVGTSLGDHLVVASGQMSGTNVQATFSVTGSNLGISLSPDSGGPNQVVTVEGTGFFPNEAINLFLEANQLGMATTDDQGNFTGTLTIPDGTPAGDYFIIAAGATSTYATRETFTVQNDSPSLSLSLNAAPPTKVVFFEGSGFFSGELLDIYFDLNDLVLVQADSSGHFSGSFNVPADASPGQHWVTATGRTSGFNAQDSFTVQTNWVQFRDGAKHTGYNAFENTLNNGNVSGLDQAWLVATKGAVSSSPSIVNGVAYVGSFDHKLYAVDTSTGNMLWTANTQGAIYSSPAVAKGIVYVGSYDKQLYAFSTADGKTVWTASTGDQIKSSPTVVGNLVYVGSNDKNLYAFKADTGESAWTASTGGAVVSSPAVCKGVVFVGSTDGKLYAFNATTGQPIWTAATSGPIQSSPAVANGTVYVGSDDDRLYAFNAVTGQLIWSSPTGNNVQSSPAVANGVVYVGSDDGRVYAFNAPDGSGLWTTILGGKVKSSPAVANGVLYVGSTNGNLYALDIVTGNPLWTGPTGSAVFSSPAVADGVVYVGSNDDNLYAFNLASGMSPMAPRPKASALKPNLSLKPQN